MLGRLTMGKTLGQSYTYTGSAGGGGTFPWPSVPTTYFDPTAGGTAPAGTFVGGGGQNWAFNSQGVWAPYTTPPATSPAPSPVSWNPPAYTYPVQPAASPVPTQVTVTPSQFTNAASPVPTSINVTPNQFNTPIPTSINITPSAFPTVPTSIDVTPSQFPTVPTTIDVTPNQFTNPYYQPPAAGTGGGGGGGFKPPPSGGGGATSGGGGGTQTAQQPKQPLISFGLQTQPLYPTATAPAGSALTPAQQSLLAGAGYTPAQIAAMTPAQQVAAIQAAASHLTPAQQAQAAGFTPAQWATMTPAQQQAALQHSGVLPASSGIFGNISPTVLIIGGVILFLMIAGSGDEPRRKETFENA